MQGRWSTPPSLPHLLLTRQALSTSLHTPVQRLVSTGCTTASTCSSCLMTCRSRLKLTVQFHSSFAVHRVVKHTPATCSTSTHACSSAAQNSQTSSAQGQ